MKYGVEENDENLMGSVSNDALYLEKTVQREEFLRLLGEAAENLQKITFYLEDHEIHLIPSEKSFIRNGVNFTYNEPDIGKGGCKKAISFGDTVCLIPNMDVGGVSVSIWERIMKEEKQASDEIAKIGIKTQDFKITTLSAKEPESSKLYSIDVLATKNFYHLAKEQKISILDNKNSICYGEEILFYNKNKENLENHHWNKRMLQPLMNEIAIVLSYGFCCMGDSQNFYISHANNNTPPTFHLFLYDFSSKKSDLTFPILKDVPVRPEKEHVLMIFKSAVNAILYMTSNNEVTSLGFKEKKPRASNSEFGEYQTKKIIENNQLMSEMLNVAVNQLQYLVPMQKDMIAMDTLAPYQPEEDFKYCNILSQYHLRLDKETKSSARSMSIFAHNRQRCIFL